jgi:hypothetical protein
MAAEFELGPPPKDENKGGIQWKNWFNMVFEKLRGPLWDDYTTAISGGKVPASNAPTWDSAIGPSGNHGGYYFAVNDYIDLEPIHIKHDIKPGSLVYPHVHWTTNGTNTAVVKWELTYSIAKGHNQEAFSASTAVNVEHAGLGTAWTHMVSEVGETTGAFTAPEVDSLVNMRLKRVTNGGTENTDRCYGLTVDLHYQKDRLGTPQKAPNFYLRGRQ